MEVGYIALARGIREALWIRKLYKEFYPERFRSGTSHDFQHTVPIKCDNEGAISHSREYKASAATKHIAVAYHLTRDYCGKG